MRGLGNFIQTMLVVDTLMRQHELNFSSSNLLNVYTVVRLKKELGTNFLKGNHYLWLKNTHQPQIRLTTNIPNKDMYLDEFV